MFNDRKRVFLVFGLPRSGTSLVARVLHTLDVPMGDHLKCNSDWCRDGLYEDLDFDERIKELVNSTNTSCAGGKLLASDRPDLIADLRALVQLRHAEHGKWGVKNLLIPWILQSFAEWCAPAELALIRCWREPHESIESFAACSGENIFRSAQDAGTQLLVAGKGYAVHRGPKITIDYDRLLAEPVRQTRLLAEFVDQPWFAPVAECVDRTQRRFGVCAAS